MNRGQTVTMSRGQAVTMSRGQAVTNGAGLEAPRDCGAWGLAATWTSAAGGGMSSGRTAVDAIDARALARKLDRTACDPAARAILGSLLLYVSAREQGPPSAAGDPRPCRRRPESQEAARRPTRFQLLQAKFLGAGREPHLKRTREVGRLIPRDGLRPGGGLVSATIDKLLDRTKERAGGLPGGEKPRWSAPAGKSTVKNILKKFLAAEQKEAQEKAARERPPAERPRAPRGLLPKVTGKSAVLSKLREKFEQSACLCSEAGLLPLRREEAKKRNLQRKKMHRPEVRVLHTATMASSCVRTPPARFLACTAEPLPALSLATVVCGPRSWLSRCSKISHAGARRQPGGQAGLRPSGSQGAEPSGDGAHGEGPLQGEPRELPQDTAGRGGPAAADAAPPDSRALSGHVCEPSPLSPLGSASPRGARTVGATAGSAADGSGAGRDARAAGPAGLPGAGAGEVPEIAMAVCSSEDEMPDADRDPFFATQNLFPEQNGLGHIPPLHTPAVRAARRAQPAAESPRVSVQRPLVHQMPPAPAALQSAPPGGDARSRVRGGETQVGHAHAAPPPAAGNGAPAELGEPCGTPVGPQTPSAQGAQAEPSPAPAPGAQGSIPDAAGRTQGPPRHPAGGQESGRSFESPNSPENPKDVSAESASGLRDAVRLSPEPRGTPKPSEGPSSQDPTARRGHPHAPSPGGSSLTGAPTSRAAPPGGRAGPEDSAASSSSDAARGQEQRPPQSAQPLQVAQGNASLDFGQSRLSSSLSSLDEQPRPSIEAPREMAGAAGVAGRAPLLPGGGWHPEHPVDEAGFGTPATGLGAAEGGGLVGQWLPQEPNDPHVWAPGAAAERGIFHGQAGVAAPHQEGAAHPAPAWAARKSSPAQVGATRQGAVSGSAPGHGAQPPVPASTCPRPWGASPAGPSLSQGELPSPSENQPAARRKGIEWEKPLPSGAEVTHPPPTAPSMEAEAGRAGRAQERSPLDPRAHQHPAPSTPAAQSPWSEAQEDGPAQAGSTVLSQQGQESHPRLGKTASGCARLQPGVSGRSTVLLGPEVLQNAAGQPQEQLRPAQDLATEGESPHPPSHNHQAGALGPWAEQVRSPGQGQGTWAAKNPASPAGSPEGLGNLAAPVQGGVQGQVKGQVQGQVKGTGPGGTSQGQVQGTGQADCPVRTPPKYRSGTAQEQPAGDWVKEQSRTAQETAQGTSPRDGSRDTSRVQVKDSKEDRSRECRRNSRPETHPGQVRKKDSPR
nr:collagen alpha-1(I) chain [Microcebus murinus]